MIYPIDRESPYFIEGPACINFSGGRTSAYMLRQMQLAGSLNDPTVLAVFADTGKERRETYEFILRCELEWNIDVKVVRYPCAIDETPFEAMIRKEKYLPNPTQRICTDRLKIKQIHRFMKKTMGFDFYRKVIGLRADEPARVANFRNAPDASRIAVPLYVAGVDKRAVLARRQAQPFDLQLRDWEGNCDLCFLKGQKKKLRIIRDHPELAQWWIDRERETAATFRAHSKNYERLYQITRQQPELFDTATEDPINDIDDLNDCLCTE